MSAPGALVSFDTLNDLIATHRLEVPRLRLSAGGEMLPQHRHITATPTERVAVRRQWIDRALPQYAGVPAPTEIDWATAHGDCHFANLTTSGPTGFVHVQQQRLSAGLNSSYRSEAAGMFTRNDVST